MTEIYGVDISKTITPVMVRDAIIGCFLAAHKEVLDLMKEYGTFKSEEEFKKMKSLNVEYLIRGIFSDIKADFNNPTKEDLVKVIARLADIAKNFRNPEIVKKHYGEIMTLIDKLE